MAGKMKFCMMRFAAARRVIDPDQLHPVGPHLPSVHGDHVRFADLRASIKLQFDLFGVLRFEERGPQEESGREEGGAAQENGGAEFH